MAVAFGPTSCSSGLVRSRSEQRVYRFKELRIEKCERKLLFITYVFETGQY